jgi:hypothetical protein
MFESWVVTIYQTLFECRTAKFPSFRCLMPAWRMVSRLLLTPSIIVDRERGRERENMRVCVCVCARARARACAVTAVTFFRLPGVTQIFT